MPTKLKLIIKNNRKLALKTSHPGNQKAYFEYLSPVIDSNQHIEDKKFTKKHPFNASRESILIQYNVNYIQQSSTDVLDNKKKDYSGY